MFAAPRRSRDRFFTMLVRENGLGLARLGIAVGKKHVRRAVDRNRIKRQVRETFRHHAAMLGGIDVVVLARFNGAATKATMARSLADHFKRLSRPRDAASAANPPRQQQRAP